MYYLKLSLLLGSLMLGAACATPLPPKMIDHQGGQVDVNDAGSCLSCHTDMKEHSHPVMINYPPDGSKKGYAAASDVERTGIKLIDGQVTCITCHDLMNTESAHLAKPMDNSQLCLVCHIK